MNAFTWSLLCALTWGIVPLVEKLGLAKIDPFVGLFYRCMGVVIGIMILLTLNARAIGASIKSLPPGFPYLVLGGFLASFVGQTFFYNALKTGDVSKVAPISGSYPLIAFILGIVFLGEKITLAKAAGMMFVVTGVLLLK